MAVRRDVRRRANTYFFGKVLANALLLVIGVILISTFLRRVQESTAISRQLHNSEQSLAEAFSILEKNEEGAKELTRVFHDGNQDMADDLLELMNSGLFSSLVNSDHDAQAEVFTDIIDRSGVEYLFVMSTDGRILFSPVQEYNGKNPVDLGLLTEENVGKLVAGTRGENGTVTPVREDNSFGNFYFYSTRGYYRRQDFALVLGADVSTLDSQTSSLRDIPFVLDRSPVGNGGFMFAVDTAKNVFLYYKNGEEIMTGRSALETGLSEAAFEDGYSGIETIRGTSYYCVSKKFGPDTVICAAAKTQDVFRDDKYVLFWSTIGFVIVMILCLLYAVIIRNDFVRRAFKTEKKVLYKSKDLTLMFDRSIFEKIYPLMIVGVMLIFGISFYTQTLLEISQTAEESRVALEEVAGRYDESSENRKVIREYYNNRFLSKAKLIAYLIEEDPSVLNEPTSFVHYDYVEDEKVYQIDDEGNRLKSVGSSEKLLDLCERNDLESIYIFDEHGNTIATSTPNWFFYLSHDEEAQSSPFYDVIDGKKDTLVQEPMTSDMGEESQYIGVVFHYYTTKDSRGRTAYVSRYDYESSLEKGKKGNKKAAAESEAEAEEEEQGITEHRSLLQIGMKGELTDSLLEPTELSYIFSTSTLKGGHMILFDASEEQVCRYAPNETWIGMTAEELEVPAEALKGEEYYGFTRVSGIPYFQFYRYMDGYYVGAMIPESEMFQSRMKNSLIAALTSLILLIFLSATVTLTSAEEEKLFASADKKSGSRLDAAIFNIILPSGSTVSTVSASARWDNRSIPWREKAPEQKLLTMVSAIFIVLILYILVSIRFANSAFREDGVVMYILSGRWERGLNIFAFSAAMLVAVTTMILLEVIRFPLRVLTSLLGARGETIGHLMISVMKYGGVLGVIFYCLHLFGVDSTSLLASAGILSLIIGLGAQSLIKDIIAGIFIVFEGEFRVGDIVTIHDYRGKVMDIGLRTTKILGSDGNVKIYNNSEISGVLNMTKDASYSLCYIDIEYGQDIEYVEEVLNRELPDLKKKNNLILDGPTFAGVNALGASGVTLLILCKCNEEDILGVNRYLKRGVLQIFYRNNIRVPFPNLTISSLEPPEKREAEEKKIEGEEEKEKEEEAPRKDDGIFES